MRNRVLRRAVLSAAVLLLAVSAVVYADVLAPDGDTVTPSLQTFVDLGTAPAGSTRTVEVGFVLLCLHTSHADRGTVISLTPINPVSPTGGSISGTPTTIGPVPATWPLDGEACPDDIEYQGTSTSLVTIVAPPAAGVYTYKLSYARSPSDGLSSSTTVTYRLTVIANAAPVVTVGSNATLEAEGPGGATFAFSSSASDAEDGSLPATCSPASGSLFPLGTTTVTCSATDSAGATGSASFTVTVVDTTAPGLSGLPGDLTAEATGPDGAAVSWASPSATDAVDGAIPVGCAPASGSVFALGSTTVTCSATDAAGNGDSSSFTVTVVDTARPVLSGVPADIAADTTDPTGMDIAWTAPAATDNIDGPVAVTCAPTSGSRFPIGTTTVTCSAADAAGNTASGSFNVAVTLTVIGGDDVTADWEPPFDGSSPFVANGRGTLPMKGQFTLGGVVLLPPAEPRLVLELLTACDGTVVERLDGGAFEWLGDRWKIQLKTSLLTPGCWRASVAVGGSEGGSMLLLVGHSTTTTDGAAKNGKP